MPQEMPDHRPVVFYMNCDFCKRNQAECTRFGKNHYMCDLCEILLAKRIRTLLKF